jgi:hypothetical protein
VKKETKEKEKRAQRRYEAQYGKYAGYFDAFLGEKRRALGLGPDDSINRYLPKNREEMRIWRKELEIPLRWLRLFIDECRGEQLDQE